MKNIVKKYNEISSTFETQWSIIQIFISNWNWIVTTLGLSWVGGWCVWARETAETAPLYEKVLFTLCIILSIIFAITGIRFFWLPEIGLLEKLMPWHLACPGRVILMQTEVSLKVGLIDL